MKEINKIVYSIFIVLGVLLGACKKYDEGPAISLRSKEKRLCQTWKLTYWTDHGEEVDIGDSFYTWEFSKNGDLTVKIVNNCCPDEAGDGNTTEWRWSDDKESIEALSFNDSEIWFTYQIKKLKYKELILEYTSSEHEYRSEFEPYEK